MTTDRPKTFGIRDARSEELDAVSAVIAAAYEQYAPVFPSEQWRAYADDIANVRSRLNEADLIVAERGGRIAGTVTFYQDGSSGGWPEGWAAIRLLAVHPDSRGPGIGRALTEECIERCRERGIATVGLHTTEAMSVARGMYERMGFKRVPQFDFRPSADVVVMAYRLEVSAGR